MTGLEIVGVCLGSMVAALTIAFVLVATAVRPYRNSVLADTTRRRDQS